MLPLIRNSLVALSMFCVALLGYASEAIAADVTAYQPIPDLRRGAYALVQAPSGSGVAIKKMRPRYYEQTTKAKWLPHSQVAPRSKPHFVKLFRESRRLWGAEVDTIHKLSRRKRQFAHETVAEKMRAQFSWAAATVGFIAKDHVILFLESLSFGERYALFGHAVESGKNASLYLAKVRSAGLGVHAENDIAPGQFVTTQTGVLRHISEVNEFIEEVLQHYISRGESDVSASNAVASVLSRIARFSSDIRFPVSGTKFQGKPILKRDFFLDSSQKNNLASYINDCVSGDNVYPLTVMTPKRCELVLLSTEHIPARGALSRAYGYRYWENLGEQRLDLSNTSASPISLQDIK